MKQLRAKLYELEMHQRDAARKVLEDSKADIGWGSQIPQLCFGTNHGSKIFAPVLRKRPHRQCSTVTWTRLSKPR